MTPVISKLEGVILKLNLKIPTHIVKRNEETETIGEVKIDDFKEII